MRVCENGVDLCGHALTFIQVFLSDGDNTISRTYYYSVILADTLLDITITQKPIHKYLSTFRLKNRNLHIQRDPVSDVRLTHHHRTFACNRHRLLLTNKHLISSLIISSILLKQSFLICWRGRGEQKLLECRSESHPCSHT